MSAESNRKIKEFIALFRETWAECEAFRNKQKIEAMGKEANWNACLKAANTQAKEIFEPLFAALKKNKPVIRLLDDVRNQLEASRK